MPGTGILERIGMAPPAPPKLVPLDEEEKEKERPKAGTGILSRIGLAPPAAPAALPDAAKEEEARREEARARLEAAKAGGAAQWEEIQEGQFEEARRPFRPSEMAGDAVDFARNVGKGAIRSVEAVGEMIGGAMQAAGAALQQPTRVDDPSLAARGMVGASAPGAAVPWREEPNAGAGEVRPVGPVAQTAGERLRELGAEGATKIGPQDRHFAAREPGYIPDDFWQGMKTDPFKTLVVNGVENIGPLAAMFGATAVAGPGAGLATAGALTTGGVFNEAKERGASDEEALEAVGWTVVPSVVLEYFPVGKAISRMAKGVPKGEVLRVVQNGLKSAVEEGVTESMQRVVEILGARAAYAEERGWGWDEAKDVLMNGIIGAVTGGPMGGLSTAAGSAESQAAPPPNGDRQPTAPPEQEAESAASTVEPEPVARPVPLDQPAPSVAGPVRLPEPTPPPARSSPPSPEGGGAGAPAESQIETLRRVTREMAAQEEAAAGEEGEAPSLRRRIARAVDPSVRQEEERRAVAERERDTDALTGVANRRALDRALPAAEADPGTAVVVFDANDFGQVNKVAGQEAGDAAIKKMAEAVRTAADESGVGGRVFRRGGDEMVVLAPASTAATVRDRAEELFGQVEGDGYRVTVTGEVGQTFADADSRLQSRKAERKATESTPAPPQATQDAPAPSEATSPAPEAPASPQTREIAAESARGGVAQASPRDLVIEPERFQYKLNRDAAGATGSLAGVQEWDANLAGVVSVWRDPTDGKLRVVNGHNRVAKARQLGVEDVRVMEINAPTAAAARSIGAMQNIAEGQGTPIDAAKFFRDSGVTEGGPESRRLPMSKATVDEGMGLAGLSSFLFNQVVSGDLAPKRGAIIGRHLKGKDDLQAQLYKEIAKREKRSRVTNEMVEDIARRMEQSGTVTEESNQDSLFGDAGSTERSLAFEEAEIAADVRSRLRKAKSAFGNAARNAPLLEEAGNQIDAEMSRGLSEEAAVNLAVFEKLRSRTEIAGIINEAARDLVAGKETTDAIKKRAFDQIREAVASALGVRAAGRLEGVREAEGRGSSPDRAADPEQLTEADEAARGRQALEEQGQGGLFGGAAGAADVGGYAPSRPTADRQRTMPLNLPELVEVAQELGAGRLPRVKKALRSARGRAVGQFRSAEGDPEQAGILLRADLAADPEQAARTLAHEIGHWVDFLPEATLKRGNILGSVASLKRHLAGFLDAVPADPSLVFSPKERSAIRRAAKKSGEDPAAALAREAKARDLVGRDEMVDELKALSRKWKPIPKNASPEYMKYRDSPRELYADAVSVLLNDPALLETEAPLFTRSFFGYLNRKPEVARAYLDIQKRIAEGEEARLDKIEERVANMVQRGSILRAQEMLSRQEEVTLGQAARNAAHAVVDGMIDRHSPIARRVHAARKRGLALSPKANPLYWLEEMAYVNSEAAAYLDRFQEALLYPLRAVGINDAELGELLFLRRVAGERAALWNPLGVDEKVARKVVERLEGRWGKDKSKLVTESLNQWWRLRQPLIEKVIDSGIVTAENSEKMRTNPEYARFFVQQYLAEAGNAPKGSALGALKEQIGTVQEIGNPLVETVLTDVALLRIAHRNSTARTIVDFMQQNVPEEVQVADRGPGGRYAETSDRKRATVQYKVDGELKGVHLPAEVAASLETHLQANPLYQAWMRFGQSPIRAVFVERNPGWAVWNLGRDVQAFWKQVVKGDPFTSTARTVAHLAKAAPHAWRAVAGKNSEIVREMLEKRMLVQPGERMYRAAEIDEATALNEVLQHYHLFGAYQAKDPGWQAKWGRFLDRFTPFSKKPGEFSERWTKIAGYMYLKANQEQLGLSDQEVAHQVRTRVGTPDVYRRGKWFRLYNSMILFSNVNKEGWRAAVETAKERPGEYAAKTFVQVGGAAVLSHAVGYALFGDDWEEWWGKVPDHDKRSFLILPMGWEGEGRGRKALYTRVPLDYTGQVVNAVIQTAFSGEKKLRERKDDLGRLFVESFPYSWANFHPYLEVGLATFTYAGEGKNPYDHFMGRQIIKPKTWDADKYGGDALTEFSRWMWNQLGGRLILQWDTEELDRERGPLEGALHWPIVGPFLGRVYKVSSYGMEEKAWRLLEEERGEKAALSIARDRMLLQALDAEPMMEPKDLAKKLHGAMRDLGIAYDSRGTLEKRIEELRARHLDNDPLGRVATFAQSKETRERVLALAEAEAADAPEDDEEAENP